MLNKFYLFIILEINKLKIRKKSYNNEKNRHWYFLSAFLLNLHTIRIKWPNLTKMSNSAHG